MLSISSFILTVGSAHCLTVPAGLINSYIFALLLAAVVHTYICDDHLLKLLIPVSVGVLVLVERFGIRIRHGTGSIVTAIIGLVALMFLNDFALQILLAFVCLSPMSPLSLKLHTFLLPNAKALLSGSFTSSYADNSHKVCPEANAKRGIFGLSHILLNLDENSSQWGNLGNWRPDPTIDQFLAYYPHSMKTSYTTAASRLAATVYNAAGLYTTKTPLQVLDVGFGSGDQLFMLSSQLTHIRGTASTTDASSSSASGSDCVLVGVNLCPAQVAAAKARAQVLLPTPPATNGADNTKTARYTPRLHLCQGSATALASALEDNNLPSQGYTHVTCIDTAYHFQTRRTFLSDVFARLCGGGVLAYTDIVLGDGVSSRAERVTKLLGGLCSIPGVNILQQEQHRKEVESLGFRNVVIRNLNAELSDFSEFMDQFMSTWGSVVVPYQWYKFLLTARMLRMAINNGYIQYVLVTANKPEIS